MTAIARLILGAIIVVLVAAPAPLAAEDPQTPAAPPTDSDGEVQSPGAFTTRLSAPWSLLTVTQALTPAELTGGDAAIASIVRWDGVAQQYEVWRDKAPPASNTLHDLAAGDAVWVLARADTVLNQPAFREAQGLFLGIGWHLLSWTGDGASVDVVRSTFGARRLLGFDAEEQAFIDYGVGPGEARIAHGEPLWIFRNAPGPAIVPARAKLRLEIRLHHEIFPDGQRDESEDSADGLRVTLADALAPEAETEATPFGDGLYVLDDVAPGEQTLRIEGEGIDLVVESTRDVFAAGEPLIVETFTDTVLQFGLLTGTLLGPVAAEETAIRPFGAPNPGYPPHEGIDFFVEAGTEVFASSPGRVFWAATLENPPCVTRAVGIRTPQGDIVWSLHLDEIFVAEGDLVGYGDPIGTVIDATLDACIVGLADHSHLELRVHADDGYESIDPEPFLIEPIRVPRFVEQPQDEPAPP